MDLINLIVRIIAFCASLLILLEFIVSCNVNTKYSLISLSICTFIVIILFYLYVCYYKQYNYFFLFISSCKESIIAFLAILGSKDL